MEAFDVYIFSTKEKCNHFGSCKKYFCINKLFLLHSKKKKEEEGNDTNATTSLPLCLCLDRAYLSLKNTEDINQTPYQIKLPFLPSSHRRGSPHPTDQSLHMCLDL